MKGKNYKLVAIFNRCNKNATLPNETARNTVCEVNISKTQISNRKRPGLVVFIM